MPLREKVKWKWQKIKFFKFLKRKLPETQEPASLGNKVAEVCRLRHDNYGQEGMRREGRGVTSPSGNFCHVMR